MKKLLLVLTTLLSVSAFAQKAMTITLDSPVTNQTIHKNEAFELKATITNTGTDSILSTDTILLYATYNGLSLFTNQQGQPVYLIVGHNSIAMDSSVVIRINYGGISYVDTTADMCMGVVFTDGTSNSSSCNSVTYVNHMVGVKELAAAKSLQVFPNPAVDVLNITFNYAETTQLTIMDITGRTVKTMPIEAGSAKVNVGDMAKGVYLYSITTTEGQLIKSGKFSVSK